MHAFRWIVAIGLVSFSCGDPEYGGQSRALRLRLGLGGCTSVAASQSTLAKGGQTDLVIGDPKKRERLDVTSEAPAVISIATAAVTLQCDGSKCEQTTGKAILSADGEGSAKIVISGDGATVDSVTITVAPATSMRVEDDKQNTGTVHAKLGTNLNLVAKLFTGTTELFAKTPFRWKVEGDALKPTTETSSRLSVSPQAVGTSTVTGQFGELGASIQVIVDP